MRQILQNFNRKIFLPLILMLGFSSIGFSQSVTISTGNCTATADEFQFDVFVTNNSAVALQFNSTVIRLTHSAAILAAGTNTMVFSYVGGSDFPNVWPPLSSPAFTYTAATRLFGVSTSTGVYLNGGTCAAPNIAVNETKKLGRFSLKNTAQNFVPGADVGLAWSTTTIVNAYVNCAMGTTGFNTVNGNRVLTAPCSLFIPASCAVPSGTPAGTTGGAQVCSNITVQPTGSTFTDASCNLIAKVLPSGLAPVSGVVNTCVKIDADVQVFRTKPYVQRHYDIEPQTNAAGATATLTLYFKQEEFDAYNAVRGVNPPLPAAPGDAVGIINLLITQYHGQGTAPGNYPGGSELINPADNNIVWNGATNLWEVTFDVVGFSGFYLHTSVTSTPLPIDLLSFSGRNNGDQNILDWTTASEQNSGYFELQRSTDGVNFVPAGTVAAAGNSSITRNYSKQDNIRNSTAKIFYYRLKIVDQPGTVKYSTIVKIRLSGKGFGIETSPNPFTDNLRIQIEADQAENATITLTDMSGRKILRQQAQLRKGSNAILLNNFVNVPGAVYLLKVTTGSQQETIKVIKQ